MGGDGRASRVGSPALRRQSSTFRTGPRLRKKCNSCYNFFFFWCALLLEKLAFRDNQAAADGDDEGRRHPPLYFRTVVACAFEQVGKDGSR
jgi:hypothetical protein